MLSHRDYVFDVTWADGKTDDGKTTAIYRGRLFRACNRCMRNFGDDGLTLTLSRMY